MNIQFNLLMLKNNKINVATSLRFQSNSGEEIHTARQTSGFGFIGDAL